MGEEGLGKFIQLEDDEATGAKKGYVKDKDVAEMAARYSESDYREKGDVEGANRSAEYGIGNNIAREVTKKSLSDSVYGRNREPSEREASRISKDAYEEGYAAQKEYKAFIAESDKEELDKLRKQIRE